MKKQRLLSIFLSAVLLLCGSVILSLPKDSHADTINLPCTGQTTCYNSSGAEIACAGTGQDGDKKMGLGWPNSRFISNGGDCVWDTLTNLLWAKNADRPPGPKTWQGALDYVKSLNANGGLCGQTGWRIPQRSELESLMNDGFNNETCGASKCTSYEDWLLTQGFINVQVSYWSSSNFADLTDDAWSVNLSYGFVTYSPKTYYNNVWPVHDGL